MPNNTPPAALFELNAAPFNWDDIIPADLLTNIANFGDLDMRLRVAASPSITADTAQALLAIGDERLAVALRANPNVPRRIIALSLNVKKIARAARRDGKRDVRRAENFRSTYVSVLGNRVAARQQAAAAA